MPEEDNDTSEENQNSITAFNLNAEKNERFFLHSIIFLKCIGIIAIFIFAFSFAGYNFPGDFLSILSVIGCGLSIALASTAIGGLFGLLFAIPRNPSKKKKKSEKTTNEIENPRNFIFNNNLVKVSDWLVTIIVGLGLTELHAIPSKMAQLTLFLKPAMGDSERGGVFGVCIAIFYLITGFIVFFIWLILHLLQLFEKAERDLITGKKNRKILEKLSIEMGERNYLGSKDSINKIFGKEIPVTSNLEKSPEEYKKKFHEYALEVSNTKKEKDFTFEDWYYSGISKYLNGDFKNCIEFLKNAIGKNPLNPESYNYLGISYIQLEKYKDATLAFTKAILLKPDYESAYNNRGYAKSWLGEEKEAIEDYDKAVSLGGTNPKLFVNRGFSRSSLGKHMDAIEDYGKAIELNPKYDIAYYDRGIAYYKLAISQGTSGDIKENYLKLSIADYDKAIELKPDWANAYDNRGIAFYEARYYIGAIEDLSKAIELNPNIDEAYFYRGLANIGLNKKNEGCSDLKKAKDLGYKGAEEALKNNGCL